MVADCMFLSLERARQGSCVEDCLIMLLTITDLPTRGQAVYLVHQVYYQVRKVRWSLVGW